MSLQTWSRELFITIRTSLRRRWYREGRLLSRFIAKDIRREILVVSIAKVAEGVITGRVRTTNLLYVAHRLVPRPDFGPPTELRINEMWHWAGADLGGIPGGTSLVREVESRPDRG